MIFFCQAEDGIRDAQESRGLGDVYKRQMLGSFVEKEEELLSIALFGDLALNFLKDKYYGRIGIDESIADTVENGVYPAV